jgi:hypothetical protein
MKWRMVPVSARGRFGASVAVALAPLLVVSWWTAAPVEAALRPFIDWLAASLNLASSVTVTPNLTWVANTGLERSAGQDGGGVLMHIDATSVRHLLLSFPLYFALLLAQPNGKIVRNSCVGVLFLSILFCLSVCGLIFSGEVVIINHQALSANQVLPSFTVNHPPISPALFFLTTFIVYVSLAVLPIVVPFGLWGALNSGRLIQLLSADALRKEREK